MSKSDAGSLDGAAVDVLRPQILKVLSESDISTVSAKKVRIALAERPESERPANVDFEGDKKAIYALIRQCYSQYVKEANTEDPKSKKRSNETADKSKKKKRVAEENDKEQQAKRPNPLNRPLRLSDKLADVCGGNEMPRYEVIKQLWVYIKANNMQNAEKRSIVSTAHANDRSCVTTSSRTCSTARRRLRTYTAN